MPRPTGRWLRDRATAWTHIRGTHAGERTYSRASGMGVPGMDTGPHGYAVRSGLKPGVVPEWILVHGPHVHGDGPVGLHNLLPDGGEDDLAVRADQIVVALLDMRTNDFDVEEGLLDELLHALHEVVSRKSRETLRKEERGGRKTGSNREVGRGVMVEYVRARFGRDGRGN